MDSGVGIVVGGIVFFIVLFCCAWHDNNKEMKAKKIEHDYYELNYEHSNAGLDAESYEEAKAHLEILEQNYPGDDAISRRASRKIYKDDIKDLREWTNELKRAEKFDWNRSTGYILDRFKTNFKAAKNIKLENAEKAKTYMNRCLESWDKYYSLTPPNSTINVREHFKKYMGADYEPCMNDRLALTKRLSEFTETAASMQQKKIMFYKEVRQILRGNDGEMARAELLKRQYEGYTDNEVRICYQMMIKTKRVKEEKRGNRYFVNLIEH